MMKKGSTFYSGFMSWSLGTIVATRSEIAKHASNDKRVQKFYENFIQCCVCDGDIVDKRSIVCYMINVSVTKKRIYEKMGITVVCFGCGSKYVDDGTFPCVSVPFWSLLPMEKYFQKHCPPKQNYRDALHFFDTWRAFMDSKHTRILSIAGKSENVCKRCSTANVKYRCGRCHVNRYCSEACSHADWKRHAPFCKDISSVKELVITVILADPITT